MQEGNRNGPGWGWIEVVKGVGGGRTEAGRKQDGSWKGVWKGSGREGMLRMCMGNGEINFGNMVISTIFEEENLHVSLAFIAFCILFYGQVY